MSNKYWTTQLGIVDSGLVLLLQLTLLSLFTMVKPSRQRTEEREKNVPTNIREPGGTAIVTHVTWQAKKDWILVRIHISSGKHSEDHILWAAPRWKSGLLVSNRSEMVWRMCAYQLTGQSCDNTNCRRFGWNIIYICYWSKLYAYMFPV